MPHGGTFVTSEPSARRAAGLQSRAMHGLMMDFPLTLPAIFRHAERVFPRREIVTRRADKSLHRCTRRRLRRPHAAARAARCSSSASATAIASRRSAGTIISISRRTSAIPMTGAVLHTLNLRLHPDELAFIVNDADDAVVLVDETLLPLWEKIAPQTHVRHAIVVGAATAPRRVPRLRDAAAAARADVQRARSRRARRGGDVLHDRHDRQAEGRSVLASRARAAHVRRVDAERMGARRAGRRAAGRADVSRQRVGPAVRRDR